MPNCRFYKHVSATNRRGIATFEFAMALPILLLLMVAITWLGFSVIGQTEVLVEARNKAFEKRFENKSDAPLHFPILPGYDRGEDFVTETAKKTVNVSPIFKMIPGPEAACTVLAGSWDHQAMKFDEPPDLKLMARAAAIGWGGKYLDFFSQLTNPIGAFKQFGGAMKSEADNAPSVVGKDDGSGSTSGGGGVPTPPGGKTPEQSKADTEEKRKQAIKEKMDRYNALGGVVHPSSGDIRITGGELEKAEDAISDAQRESEQKSLLARNEQDEEKKKQLQEEAARAHRKVELARITLARLKAELKDVVEELDALGVEKWTLYLQSRPF
jgi:hypothetical protein